MARSPGMKRDSLKPLLFSTLQICLSQDIISQEGWSVIALVSTLKDRQWHYPKAFLPWKEDCDYKGYIQALLDVGKGRQMLDFILSSFFR